MVYDWAGVAWHGRIFEPVAERMKALPHIHALYSGMEAVFSIADGAVLAGELPTKQMRLVQAWIELHRDELAADWELAIAGQNLYKIDPL